MDKQLTVATLSLLFANSALGQELLLHLPLDGDLANSGTIAAAPELYVDSGEPEPAFTEGHSGQALMFDSRATIAVPFTLDHDLYPVVTITAWVRQGLSASGTRAVFSSGSDAGASLGIGGRLTAKAGRQRVNFDEDMPRGEWVFVAVVIDIANRYARLHQNDKVLLAEDLDTRAKLPDEYPRPDDPDGTRQSYLFIGSHTFQNWQQTDRRITFDDVRLYSGGLTVEQVNAIRDAAPVEQVSDTES
ncbi:MAG: hypothetical protein P8Y92_14710 [Halioglobus sp.]